MLTEIVSTQCNIAKSYSLPSVRVSLSPGPGLPAGVSLVSLVARPGPVWRMEVTQGRCGQEEEGQEELEEEEEDVEEETGGELTSSQ